MQGPWGRSTLTMYRNWKTAVQSSEGRRVGNQIRAGPGAEVREDPVGWDKD